MSWKDEFREAVRKYINDKHNACATEITDISDWAQGLSYGGVDYGVDISYRTEESPLVKTITYNDYLWRLIEELDG